MIRDMIAMFESGDFQPLVDAFTNGMKELFAFIEAKVAALIK